MTNNLRVSVLTVCIFIILSSCLNSLLGQSILILIFFLIYKNTVLGVILKNSFKQKKKEPDDKIVKVRNRGWYVANIRVDYELDGNNGTKQAVQQKGKIARS